MKTREQLRRISPRMWLAIVLGAGAHLLGFALFSVMAPTGARKADHSVAIGLLPPSGGGQDPIMREHLILSDQKPLYLPTEHNAGTRSLPSTVRRQPGEAFELFGALTLYPSSKLAELLPIPPVAPKSTIDALITGARGPAVSFGRSDLRALAPREAEAWVIVQSLQSGSDVLRIPIGRGQAPFAATDWEPVELTVAVDPAGLTGMPVVTKPSRVEAIDAFLPAFLVKEVRLGDRLEPGFYQVLIAH